MNETYDKVQILNMDILSLTSDELLKSLNKGILFTINVDHYIKLQNDLDFYDCYKAADWVVCDSRIIFLMAKFLRRPLLEVIPGSSFFSKFYLYHKSNPDIKIFLLGAEEGVAIKAMNNINAKVENNMVVGAHSPTFGFEKNENECFDIIKIIKGSGANVLVVGLGAPKQEKWIAKYKQYLPNINLFMALGATIDFEAGNLKRAPKWVQRFSLEWMYRLIREPGRLWKRYLVDDVAIFPLILKQKFGRYNNPFKLK